MFIGVPRIIGIVGFGSFNILFVDGCHCKDMTYEGAIILVTVKTSLAHSLSVILAFVPLENANHMSWVVQMIIKTGVDLSDLPVFTDRGNLLAAASVLEQSLGIVMNLKFCAEHIIRNINHQFRIKKAKESQVRNAVNALSGSSALDTYETKISGISCNDNLGPAIARYLLQIHPTQFTVYGNMPSFNLSVHIDRLTTTFQALQEQLQVSTPMSFHQLCLMVSHYLFITMRVTISVKVRIAQGWIQD